MANEYLKASDDNLLRSVLFNECLDKGIYPWNTTIITPLHKKGDTYNPDNYRAIAVAAISVNYFPLSCCRDLLSLETFTVRTPIISSDSSGAHRLPITFSHCTHASKNTSNMAKKRLYACFVDFKKAFDTVCRDALLYKLSTMGIEGKFLKCITYMYYHSKARIIINKLSKSFDILCGTEQGHPASPEQFKMYTHELSVDLNNTTDQNINVPELNGKSLTHLLWADDLVLLVCDCKSLQHMINKLKSCCDQWGLEVNIKLWLPHSTASSPRMRSRTRNWSLLLRLTGRSSSWSDIFKNQNKLSIFIRFILKKNGFSTKKWGQSAKITDFRDFAC